MTQDTIQHFEMIKKIINSVAKKINLPYELKPWLLDKTIRKYVNVSEKGLAYHIYAALSSNDSIFLPWNITAIIITAIKAYDKNNPYEQFYEYIKDIYMEYMRALKKRGKYYSLEEVFCKTTITRIIDCTLWWDGTPEGFDFWEEKNNEWINFIRTKLFTPNFQSILAEIKTEYVEKINPIEIINKSLL